MKKRWLPFLLCLLLAAGLILVGLFLSKKNRASGVEVFLPSAQSPSANDVTEDGSLSQSVSDNGSLKVPSVIKTDGLGYQVNDKKKAYFEKGEEGTCFQVVDAHTRKTVFTGQVDRKSTGDFSGVTAPGIYYIEAAKKSTSIHTQAKELYSLFSISYYEKELADLSFFRIHRSYLININMLKSFNGKYVTFINGEKLIISPKKYPALCCAVGSSFIL